MRTRLLATTTLATTTLAMLTTLTALGATTMRGIVGQAAPAWRVTEWINLPDGRTQLDVQDYRGKVVFLYFFQSWCPGCHARGFPTLQAMIKRFEDADDVAFVAVQTVFEGYETNTPAAARRCAQRYDLAIPVGHDGGPGARSTLMGRYRTGGTPWTVIIDKTGKVRFNDFHTTEADASRLIETLRRERMSDRGPAPPAPPVAADVELLPASRGGQEVVGKRWPTPRFDAWVRPIPRSRSRGARRPTLFRWWTDACSYCEASLPAIERLRQQYEAKGLNVVGVYHPKPARPVDGKAIARHADRLGYTGPVALDLDWSVLRAFYLDTPGAGQRRATSISVLVDAEGVIRFLHPGPVLFPSDDAEHARENADYELLEKAIRQVLAEASG